MAIPPWKTCIITAHLDWVICLSLSGSIHAATFVSLYHTLCIITTFFPSYITTFCVFYKILIFVYNDVGVKRYLDLKYNKLIVENINKNFGKKTLFSDLSFTLKSGECVGICGSNGCGKTSLFNILAGESKSYTGNIFLHNNDDDSLVDLSSNKSLRKYIGYVPQDNMLIETLSAYDNLKLWYCDSPLNLESELNNGLLHTLGINEYLKKPVKKLSGGMKKKLSVAIAIAKNPPFLFLDEPCAALDLATKQTIREYLTDYKRGGGAILISTHDEPDLDLCDNVYVIKHGSLHEIPKSLRGKALIDKFTD